MKTITRIWYTRSHGLAQTERSKLSKHRALLFASCLAVFRYPIWIELCFYNTGSFPTSSRAAFLFRKYLKRKLFLRLHPLMDVWGSGISPDKHWLLWSLSRRLFGFNIECAVGQSLMNWLCLERSSIWLKIMLRFQEVDGVCVFCKKLNVGRNRQNIKNAKCLIKHS